MMMEIRIFDLISQFSTNAPSVIRRTLFCLQISPEEKKNTSGARYSMTSTTSTRTKLVHLDRIIYPRFRTIENVAKDDKDDF